MEKLKQFIGNLSGFNLVLFILNFHQHETLLKQETKQYLTHKYHILYVLEVTNFLL